MTSFDIKKLYEIEAAFKIVASMVRDRLALSDQISQFDFKMVSSGRTQDGDMKVEFVVGEGYYGSGNSVTSNCIHSAVEEVLRRKGFDETHKPLCLPKYHHVETPQPHVAADDEVIHANENAAASELSEDEIATGENPLFEDEQGLDEHA